MADAAADLAETRSPHSEQVNAASSPEPLRLLHVCAGGQGQLQIAHCVGLASARFVVVTLDVFEGSPGPDSPVCEIGSDLGRDLSRGTFDVVICTPPTSTFSRASFRSGAPLREASWPSGIPGLSDTQKEQVGREDAACAVCIRAFQEAVAAGSRALLLAPEDLGSTSRESPTSFWRIPAVLAFASSSLFRGSSYAAHWSQGASCLLPLALATNSPAVAHDPRVHLGWPAFSDEGRYKGPLPQSALDDLKFPRHARPPAVEAQVVLQGFYDGIVGLLVSEAEKLRKEMDTTMTVVSTPLVGGLLGQTTVGHEFHDGFADELRRAAVAHGESAPGGHGKVLRLGLGADLEGRRLSPISAPLSGRSCRHSTRSSPTP